MATLYVDSGYAVDGYVQSGIEALWGIARIYIPRSELQLVQTSPTYVYNLDLNQFRLTLKDLEDDEVGIVFLDTHNHVRPITVGGVTLARVVEIVNEYEIEFEDGQYAVNLIGANSNLADRVVSNQVSIRSANSAGLVKGADGIPTATQNADAVWAATTRTLTELGLDPATIATAVLAAAEITPIHANTKQMNDEALIGDGSEGNKFRSHLVP